MQPDGNDVENGLLPESEIDFLVKWLKIFATTTPAIISAFKSNALRDTFSDYTPL